MRKSSSLAFGSEDESWHARAGGGVVRMPKVSVIVPVYNVELYLNQCLESLLGQTLRDIEVIAVDDGSSDSSSEILHFTASRDERLKVVRVKNGGVSRARNVGIEAAAGEYVGFVDADDWAEPGMYAEMAGLADANGLDICICDFLWEYPGKRPVPGNLDLPRGAVLSRELVEEKLIKGTLYNATFGSVWKALVRRDMLVREGIRFNEKLDIMEDGMFNLHMYFHAGKVMYTRRYLYHYRQLMQSGLTRKYRSNLMELMQVVSDTVNSFMAEHDLLFSEFQPSYEFGVCFMAAYCLMNICNRRNKASAKDKIMDIRSLLDNRAVRAAIERINDNESFLKAYEAATPMQKVTYSFMKNMLLRRSAISLFLVFSTLGRYNYLLQSNGPPADTI
jgi:glycosyltransferase EpsH